MTRWTISSCGFNVGCVEKNNKRTPPTDIQKIIALRDWFELIFLAIWNTNKWKLVVRTKIFYYFIDSQEIHNVNARTKNNWTLAEFTCLNSSKLFVIDFLLETHNTHPYFRFHALRCLFPYWMVAISHAGETHFRMGRYMRQAEDK